VRTAVITSGGTIRRAERRKRQEDQVPGPGAYLISHGVGFGVVSSCVHFTFYQNSLQSHQDTKEY
jgi:hypothetical protein